MKEAPKAPLPSDYADTLRPPDSVRLFSLPRLFVFKYSHDFIHEHIKAALSGEGRIGSEQRTPVNGAARRRQVFSEVTAHGNTCLEAVQP